MVSVIKAFRRSGRKVIWIIAAAGSRGILETLNLGNNVRYGSLADIGQPIRDVRFAPESRHVQHRNQCLLCAISRHRGLRLSSGDAAGHAFRGKTRSNQTLFLGRGYCYVYFTYGSSFMVNVTSEELGVGAGVLLRALEPLQGIEMMQRFRKTTRMCDIARGPGRLAQAMQIDKRYDGVDLCAAGSLWLGTAARPKGTIGSSTRIGLKREIHRERRFFERGSPYVSGPRSLSIR